MPTWEEKLADRLDPQLADEVDKFATEITLRKQGKLDEKVFAETDRKSTRLNSSHSDRSRMPSSA